MKRVKAISKLTALVVALATTSISLFAANFAHT